MWRFIQTARWFCAVACSVASASAQPVEILEDGSANVTVPDRVVWRPQGDARVEIVVLHVATPAAALANRRQAIPVFTDFGDGRVKPGIWLGAGDLNDDRVADFPVSVKLKTAGEYELKTNRSRVLKQAAQDREGQWVCIEAPLSVPVEYLPPSAGVASGANGVILVPACVVASRDGAMRVERTSIGPVIGGPAQRARPERIPVWSEDAEGRRTVGITLENPTDRPAAAIWKPVPLCVTMRTDGSVSIERGEVGATQFPGERAGTGLFPPRYVSPKPSVIDTKAIYDNSPAIAERGLWNITFVANTTGLTTSQADLLMAQLSATKTAYELLLANNVGSVTCQVDCHNLGVNGTLASTDVFTSSRSYADVSGFLSALAFFDDESTQEQGLYANLPVGSSVAFEYSDSRTSNESSLRTCLAVAQRWGVPHLVNEFNITINLDRISSINFDPIIRVDGQVDLRGVLFHEVAHGLGFDSSMDNSSDPSPRQPTLFDLFRFATGDVETTVEASEFRNSRRSIRIGREAVLATLLGSTGSFRLSTGAPPLGDGRQGAHWKSRLLNDDGACIGMMDPGDSCLDEPGYLSLADKRALDILGWNIDLGAEPLPPDPCELVSPPTDSQVRTLEPTLIWSAGGNTSVVHVILDRVRALDTIENVIDERDIDPGDGSLAVVPGLLERGAAYRWYVVGENAMGLAHSPVGTFIIPLCFADFDLSGSVGVDDMFAFLDAWFAQFGNGGVPADPSADYDLDGTVATADLFGFLDAWFIEFETCGV